MKGLLITTKKELKEIVKDIDNTTNNKISDNTQFIIEIEEILNGQIERGDRDNYNLEALFHVFKEINKIIEEDKKMLYITKAQVQELKEILDTTKMNNCSFRGYPFKISCTPEEDVTQFIKEKTQLWRNTWITDPLERIIKKLEE